MLDRQDIRDTIAMRNAASFDVPYYRCDIDRNGIVEREDLIAVIFEVKKTNPGYNPWDLDENGYIDIRDSVILNDGDKEARERAKRDQDGDGIITIRDFILIMQNQETEKTKPAPSSSFKKILPIAAVTWARMKM